MKEQQNATGEEAASQGERLARFLAHAGIASRRRSEELIAAGRVQVNGLTVTTQGARIDPASDKVSVDGKAIQATTQHVYILLHKPIGYVSTVHDPQGRPTVLDLLPPALRALRVYPVGRLDIDTSGLLLLTNDGDFALRLAHPRYSMEKHYRAFVQGHPSTTTLDILRNGITITEDNDNRHKTAPAQVRLLKRVGSNSWLALSIHEGRKRQIRRMLAAAGHPVIQLERIGIGPLTLNKLPSGQWRNLTTAELDTMRQQLTEHSRF
ncbi:MAG TPA: pseudouridine synthase [Ktedonosporobacter sp.]|jgi:pseudouridine synthase|nr:pseudouridine synthase [Ktedonosporobacter sp.]